MFIITEDHPLHTKKNFPVGDFITHIPCSTINRDKLSVFELGIYNHLLKEWGDSNFPQEIPLSTTRLSEDFKKSIRTIQRAIEQLMKVGLIGDCGYLSGPGKKRLVSIAPYRPRNDEEQPITRVDRHLFEVPENILNLMRYWESKEKLRKLKWPSRDDNGLFLEPTKVFKSTSKLLESLIKGTFLQERKRLAQLFEIDPNKSFSEREIRLSINRFHICATDPEYFPHHKEFIRKFSLSQFIWNPFSDRKDGKFKSWFLFCYKNPPELLSDRATMPGTEVPMVVLMVKHKYAECFCGGDMGHFNQKDERNFIYAGNKLAERMRAWKKQLNMPLGSVGGAEYLMEAIQANPRIETINTKLLTYDWIFDNMAIYLHKKGVLAEYEIR